MAPHAIETEADRADTLPSKATTTKWIREPLTYSGSLDQYRSFDRTPTIGTEFPDLQLADLLDDDIKLRDLAITVSRRGVVFFRKQQLSPDQQKVLASKLGELSGKPKTSKLHKHALAESQKELAEKVLGKFDPEVWVISSDVMRNHFPGRFNTLKPLASEEWHTDLAYERAPADYSILHMRDNPEDGSGGDTLWASTYEAYDRVSPPLRKMIDGMTGFANQAKMGRVIQAHGLTVNYDRGAPENNGDDFTAVHPVVRVNPVTGWKHLYGCAGVSVREGYIEGVTKHESEMLKTYFNQLVAQNHDLQVRFKWEKGDIAVWDNRGTFHCGTDDFEGRRQGIRVMSIGEIPYYDPAGKSRREALAEEAGAR